MYKGKSYWYYTLYCFRYHRMWREIARNTIPVLVSGAIMLVILVAIGLISLIAISVLIYSIHTQLSLCGIITVIGLLMGYCIYKITRLKQSGYRKSKLWHTRRRKGDVETQDHLRPPYSPSTAQ